MIVRRSILAFLLHRYLCMTSSLLRLDSDNLEGMDPPATTGKGRRGAVAVWTKSKSHQMQTWVAKHSCQDGEAMSDHDNFPEIEPVAQQAFSISAVILARENPISKRRPHDLPFLLHRLIVLRASDVLTQSRNLPDR